MFYNPATRAEQPLEWQGLRPNPKVRLRKSPLGVSLMGCLWAFLAALALALASASAWPATIDPEQDARDALVQARQALDEQRLDRAELLLERVLMLQPDNAEARVELALLMARRGQPETARALLVGLAQDPRTPPPYRERLLTLVDGLRPSPPAVPVAARVPLALWRLESGLTWSSNPLARTRAEELFFTTPEGPVAVPLLSKPQQGAVAALSLARTQGTSGIEVQLQGVDLPRAHPAARLAAWGGWPFELFAPAVQWSASAQQGLDGASRQTAGLSWTGSSLRWSAFRYVEPELNDHGHLLRLEAQWPGLPGLQGAAHLERAASTVKDQGAWKAGLMARTLLPGQVRLQLQWNGQKDTHGYSPLLASGAPRWLLSTQWAAERGFELGSEKTITVRVLTAQRRSNIELFAFREHALQVELAKMWR